jgi:sulfur-oxidizing protein SoxZ
MAEPTIRVRVPSPVKRGEVIEIRTLIHHEMESGHRRSDDGKLAPRKILNRFACTMNGRTLFAADWHPAIAANPYLVFHLRATESGSLKFEWTDDDGTRHASEAKLLVV